MALIILVVALCLALVALGFFAPRLSRRFQGRMDRDADRAESKAESEPKPVQGMVERPLEWSRRAADKATSAGRKGRDETERTKQEH